MLAVSQGAFSFWVSHPLTTGYLTVVGNLTVPFTVTPDPSPPLPFHFYIKCSIQYKIKQLVINTVVAQSKNYWYCTN